MSYEKYGFTFGGESAHYLHKFFYFLRSEYSGRFVENQNIVVAVKHFQNFGTLLHSDGYIFDECIRVNVQMVFFRQLNYTLSCGLMFDETKPVWFDTENYIVEHRKDLNKLEMLVHHADTESICVVRVVYRDLLSVFEDFSFIGLIKSEQYAHER